MSDRVLTMSSIFQRRIGTTKRGRSQGSRYHVAVIAMSSIFFLSQNVYRISTSVYMDLNIPTLVSSAPFDGRNPHPKAQTLQGLPVQGELS